MNSQRWTAGSGGGLQKQVNGTAAASLALSASAVRSVTRGGDEIGEAVPGEPSANGGFMSSSSKRRLERRRKQFQALCPGAARDFQSGMCVKVRRRGTYVADKAQPSSGTICAWPLTHTDRSPVRQLSADWLVQPRGAGLRLLVINGTAASPVRTVLLVSNIIFQRSMSGGHSILKTSVSTFPVRRQHPVLTKYTACTIVS